MSHVHDCSTTACNNYTACGLDDCKVDQSAPCYDCLLKELNTCRSKIEKFKRALEEISDQDDCSYGPPYNIPHKSDGCSQCTARRALFEDED